MTTTAIENIQKGAQSKMKTLLNSALPQLKEVAPRHLSPERLIKIALSATSKDSKLLECSPGSILLAVMKATELGLEPGGMLGEAYLVPYKTKNGMLCQLIPGYRGLIKLARQSGQIAKIESQCVYEEDIFEIEYGTSQRIKHVPYLDGDRGKLRLVYAVATFKEGETQVDFMTLDQIEKIRKMSKGPRDYGPWVDHYDEMARKTVVRRLCKYLPLSVELAQALEHQAMAEAGKVSVMDTTGEVILEAVSEVVSEEEQERELSAADKVKAKLQAAKEEKPVREPGEEG